MSSDRPTRRNALAGMASALLLAPLGAASLAAARAEITAYRNPGCGCCEKWAASLERAGFSVKLVNAPDLAARRAAAGVPPQLAGCHTALLGDHVIEGHVPAEDILRFLAERPPARGLAVAGMPIGSPGMEAGGEREPYEVMLIEPDGRWRVYARH